MLMANDNDSNQLRFGIVNAYNYWIEVIQPNWVNFENTPTPRTAFNLATSLWSVMDWIRHDPVHGMQQLKIEEIRQHFQGKCPALGIVHDLGTHGKHYTVRAPRGAASVDAGELTGAVFCFSTPYGPISEQTADFAVVLDEGEQVSLHEIFRQAMNFWHSYFNKN
ncbi:hypothetical protein ACFQUU_01020 [Herbaspirillum sp. GCM10030257]|uniref:hypothetical protein n=1 Tax=Herbaspirillum sp. GCM10030257 TaxID=3273393 RepID=UPI003606E440